MAVGPKIPPEAYQYQSQMAFKDHLDWLIAFKSPVAIWNEMPSHLLVEVLFYFGGLACFLHAFRRGGRWPLFCLATIGHGLVVEVISYYVPDIDSFWHAQSMVMLIGRRLPLHILLVYTVFYYQAAWAVSKLKLKCPYSEHLAVGLLAILIDLPYDITGIRFMNWTWHDTDPNIYERTFYVPWTSYMFHFTFALSMSLIFQKSRKVFEKRALDKWEKGSLISEIFAVIMASVFSMPLGSLMFMGSYHILHDFLLISTEAALMPIFGICLLVVWKFERKSNRYEYPERKKGVFEKILFVYLTCHYLLFLGINVFLSPEQHISTSLHEPVGDCKQTKVVKTILKDLQKKEFLCATDYDEKYFDFKCLKELPPAGSTWYTICGTPYENRAEHIWILTSIAVAALLVFRTIHFDKDGKLLQMLHGSKDKKAKKKN